MQNNINNAISNTKNSSDKNNNQPFENLYSNIIEPLIIPYENERLHAFWITLIKIIFINISLIALDFFVYSTMHLNIEDEVARYIISAPLIVDFLATCLVYETADSKIRKEAKYNILKPMTPLIGELIWTEEHLITRSDIQKFKFCLRAEEETADDGFKGSLEEVPVKIQEIYLEHTEGAGRSRHEVIDFKGIAISLRMNKTFKGLTIVKRDLGNFLGLNRNAKSIAGLEKVALESIDFEKEFEVYSSDQVEARYILTTSFMEKLENIKNDFSAKYVECGFFEGHVLFLLWTQKDMFEVGDLIHSFKNKEMYEEAYNEMKSISEMIKHLKLNIKTGL